MRSWKTFAAVMAAVLAVTGLAGSAVPVAQAAPNDPFNPKVVFTRSTDAARRETRFYLKVDQADGEQQIGTLKLSLPGGPTDFLLNTDIPGINYDATKDAAGNAPANLGTFHIEAYYSANGNPARTTIALDGQVYDDNDNVADCPGTGECIRVQAVVPIPGYNFTLDAALEIPHTATHYEVIADIGGLWNDSIVRQLDIRLKQLIIDLPAKKGANHVTFRNPTVAGTNYSFDYELRSAKIDALGHAGGQAAACGATCSIPLPTKDYAPTPPTAKQPFNGQIFAAGTNTTLSWQTSTDLNLDEPMAYEVTLDNVTTPTGTATSFAAGALPVGIHTWSVRATDSHGETTTAGPYTIDVRDLARALTFTSVVVNGDKLHVFPGAGSGFIYSIDGSTAQNKQFGAKVSGLTDTGLINYEGRFRLVALYAAPLKSAAGIFEPTAPRPLTGVGTGTGPAA